MGVRVVFPDMGKDPSVQLIEKTITENGTYDAITDGANGYSKVNVNVEGGGGSSDFSTATVTLIASDIDIRTFVEGLPVLESDGLRTEYELNLEAHGQVEKTIALYKGKAIITSFGMALNVTNMTGNITDDGTAYVITGDCSITFAPKD